GPAGGGHRSRLQQEPARLAGAAQLRNVHGRRDTGAGVRLLRRRRLQLLALSFPQSTHSNGGRMNTTRVLFAGLAALLVADCVGKQKPSANCAAVAAACTKDDDCCSGGCVSGACACNPNETGLCGTTNDCCSGLACKDNACATGCREDATRCTAHADCCSTFCNGTTCATCSASGSACSATSVCCPGSRCN